MTESILPPFERANQTPDGLSAYVYTFKPQKEGLWVCAHHWADVLPAIEDTEDVVFQIKRTVVDRETYEEMREQESDFDGW